MSPGVSLHVDAKRSPRPVPRWREYRHTQVNIDLEVGVRRALEVQAFLEGVRTSGIRNGGIENSSDLSISTGR